MKKRAIITYILAFALLLSACVYRIPQETEGGSDPALQGTSAPTTQGIESTPTHSDTSTSPSHEHEATQPTYYYTDWVDVTEPTFTEDEIIYTDNGIIAGPFTFEYVDDSWAFVYGKPAIELKGLNLVYCQINAEKMVIPSEVCGIPVVAIAYHHPQGPALDLPIFSNENVALKTLYITDSILHIDDGAFYGCEELEGVRLSHRLTFMGATDSDYGEPMFKDTSITFLEVPEGVTTLKYYTFERSNIEYLVLPSTLTGMSQNCMTDCPLRSIYLRASKDHYKESFLEEISKQTDATLYFYSEMEPTEEGNFWHYVDGQPVIW